LTGLNKYIKISLNYFLGPLVFVWVAFSIYQKIRHQPDFSQSLRYIREAANGSYAFAFWMVVALMFLNWGIEARKWQVLMKPLQKISLWRSFKAVMTGVSLALNTPNRIGEYGGRILYVEEGKRIPAISLTVVGSFSQLLITMFMGALGLFFLSGDIVSRGMGSGGSTIWFNVVFYLVVIMGALGVLVYFKLGWLLKGFEKLPGLSSLIYHVRIVEDLNVTILLRVLSLSAGRYIVFVIQYILLMRVMHVEMSEWQALWTTSILFLVLAIVPTIALAELGIRWGASVELFKLFSSNIVGIYATATGIWLINLVIPALAGSLLILGIKIYKDKL